MADGTRSIQNSTDAAAKISCPYDQPAPAHYGGIPSIVHHSLKYELGIGFMAEVTYVDKNPARTLSRHDSQTIRDRPQTQVAHPKCVSVGEYHVSRMVALSCLS